MPRAVRAAVAHRDAERHGALACPRRGEPSPPRVFPGNAAPTHPARESEPRDRHPRAEHPPVLAEGRRDAGRVAPAGRLPRVRSMARPDHLVPRARPRFSWSPTATGWGLDPSRPGGARAGLRVARRRRSRPGHSRGPVCRRGQSSTSSVGQGARPAFGVGGPTGRTGRTNSAGRGASRSRGRGNGGPLPRSSAWRPADHQRGRPGIAVTGRDDAASSRTAAPRRRRRSRPLLPPAAPATPELPEHWRTVLERAALLVALGDIESLEQAAKTLRQVREAPLEARPDDLEARSMPSGGDRRPDDQEILALRPWGPVCG